LSVARDSGRHRASPPTAPVPHAPHRADADRSSGSIFLDGITYDLRLPFTRPPETEPSMSTRAEQLTPIPEPTAEASRLRFVTAAALFDGHDAAINVMRRLI